MRQQRTIVVNSLLCFLHNYRAHAAIREIVTEAFTDEEIAAALRILQRHCSSREPSLFTLYDRLAAERRLPVLATASLRGLPLQLLQAAEQNVVLREIRCLRSFIADALNGRLPEEEQDTESRVVYNDVAVDEEAETMNVVETSEEGGGAAASCSLEEPAVKTEPDFPSLESPPPQQPVAQSSGPLKRRRACGRSLDETVAKLRTRQTEATEPPSPAAHEEVATEASPGERECEETRPPAPPPAALAVPLPSAATPLVTQPTTPWSTPAVTAALHIHPMAMIVQSIMSQQASAAYLASSSAVSPDDSQKTTNEEEDDEDKAEDLEQLTEESTSPSPSEFDDSEKPYICSHSECAKRFTNKFLLKKHMFIHTGLRPHGCPFCHKKFNRKDNLLRHKKTHLCAEEGEQSGRLTLEMLASAAAASPSAQHDDE